MNASIDALEEELRVARRCIVAIRDLQAQTNRGSGERFRNALDLARSYCASRGIGLEYSERPAADFAAFVSFNEERQRWTDPRLTYAQAVANCTRGLGRPEQVYTVTFSTPGGRSGTLTRGQETEVEDGMVIDAAITNRA